MRAVVLRGVQNLVVEDVPRPKISEDEVLIKVAYCGICGSDLHCYFAGGFPPFGWPVGDPRIMGHEFSGDIVEVGAGVERLKVGDRVAVFPVEVCGDCYFCKRGQFELCNSFKHIGGAPDDGAYAEYTKVKADMAYKLPDEVTYMQGALVEPVSNPVHSLKLAGMQAGETVFVSGAGPIGLSAMMCARAFGASKIYASEVSEVRLEKAKRVADVVFNPEEVDLVKEIYELTDGLGADIVLECSGSIAAQEQSVKLVRKGGKIVIIGLDLSGSFKLSTADIAFKELTIIGSFASSSYYGKGVYQETIQLIQTGKINPEIMVTSTISLDDLDEKGFKKLATSKKEVKILVKP